MSSERDKDIEELLRLVPQMLQGSLSRTFRTCGTPGCHCHTGQKHGPHTYFVFKRDNGRSSSVYVPQRDIERFAAGVKAWKRFLEVASKLAAQNRQEIVDERRAQRRRKADARKA